MAWTIRSMSLRAAARSSVAFGSGLTNPLARPSAVFGKPSNGSGLPTAEFMIVLVLFRAGRFFALSSPPRGEGWPLARPSGGTYPSIQ